MIFSIYKIQNLHARIALAIVWLGVAIHIILLKTKKIKNSIAFILTERVKPFPE